MYLTSQEREQGCKMNTIPSCRNHLECLKPTDQKCVWNQVIAQLKFIFSRDRQKLTCHEDSVGFMQCTNKRGKKLGISSCKTGTEAGDLSQALRDQDKKEGREMDIHNTEGQRQKECKPGFDNLGSNFTAV